MIEIPRGSLFPCTRKRSIMEIPKGFASVKSIAQYGSHQLKDSAMMIEEYVKDMMREDKLGVIF